MQRFKDTKFHSEKGYHRLLVWQRTYELVLLVYKVTESFPKSETYGIVSQMRRAALSVLLNIVEGARRRSKKEFLRSLIYQMAP